MHITTMHHVYIPDCPLRCCAAPVPCSYCHHPLPHMSPAVHCSPGTYAARSLAALTALTLNYALTDKAVTGAADSNPKDDLHPNAAVPCSAPGSSQVPGFGSSYEELSSQHHGGELTASPWPLSCG